MISENQLLPCFSKTFFGFECLGCGIQRSFLFLINGEFWNAFKMYPAIFTIIGFAFFIILNWKIKFKNANKIISRLAYLNLSIILLQYFIKLTI
ncbi:MAG: DUF2752 domain-containing protein [Polaribacter sp.]|nr:DUF2752 domain-containing protein [Polaribacter sp.]